MVRELVGRSVGLCASTRRLLGSASCCLHLGTFPVLLLFPTNAFNIVARGLVYGHANAAGLGID